MQLLVNGLNQQVTDDALTLAEWLAESDAEGRFAIAVNESFIPRHRYTATQLHDGDRIDIVVAMQGG
ncbi:MAG: sulfur carrier protein ThiS [Reinekea sp.]|jgi:sulfur carrier protein